MFNDRLERVGDYPFDRLRALLDPLAPPDRDATISLALGEPQHAPPTLIRDTVHRFPELWGRYPPMKGTPEARAAIADWLQRRYALPDGMIDPEANVVPVSGTREALFMIALAAVPERKANKKPVVLMPNPFYQVYAGAAVLAGAEPVFLPATAETGFLPDLAALGADVLDRTAPGYPDPNPDCMELLAERGVRRTDFADWRTLDAAEIAAATPPAPRRKLSRIGKMLDILDGADDRRSVG